MKVKMILPSQVGTDSPFFRPLKYSLFPPLGMATLAAYLVPDDEVDIQDEHVERLDLDDDPDLVVIEVYVSSAWRAYEIADHYRRRGAHVCLGGLHVTSCPEEAMSHADTIFLGPGEDTWPHFLTDFALGTPKPVYESTVRTLVGAPPPRRDLLKLHRYLVPNTIVVSRGCPHHCEFCYKDSFFKGGSGFYTAAVDDALGQIAALPGRHVYFLDDNLFADGRFAGALFEGMRGMGRLWQAAATVESVLRPGLLEQAAEAGVRSLFIGFETLSQGNLRSVGKVQNLGRDYELAIRRMHDHGVMVNASFVFGLDGDGPDVFDRTVDWAVAQGIETATFHILTPYPGTALHERLRREGRIVTENWELYDTRHVVFQPSGMTATQLEAGHRRAYEQFYRWRRILDAASTKAEFTDRVRHVLYTGGWKKCEGLWNLAIKLGHLPRFLPLLEAVLSAFGRYPAAAGAGKTTSGTRAASVTKPIGTLMKGNV